MLMKKNHFFTYSKMCVLALTGASALFLASCAGDGFSDESFQSGNGVTNTKLTTPTIEEITIEVSTDGSKQTISWPVVNGAGGYKAVLVNTTTNEVLVDSIIDNLSFATSREEDTNYKLTLQVLGNTKLGNTDGDVVDKTFSSFTASYAQIPAGVDLYQYFQSNPIPDDQTDELNYDLAAGGKYTLSGQLGFNYHKVCLRSTDKGNPATIEIGDNASFVASNNFSLKYLNIDIKASVENARPVIELYNYETAPDGILEKPKNYYIIPAVNIIGCKLTNVIGNIIYDNNKSYAISGLTFKNTLIQLSTVKEKIKNEAIMAFQGGGVKDFTMTNCTVYSISEGAKPTYFLRYNNSIRVDRITGSNTDFTTFTWTNNTFYKLIDNGDGKWYNGNGVENYSTYTAYNNIWVDCSKQIVRRMMGNGRLGNSSQIRLSRNTYWSGGEAADQATYDTSGTILTTDPAFANPANGDFTPTGAEQLQYKTGDSRWYE